MLLIPGISTAKDLFEKLKRDAAILDKEVSSDAFFNFVITGYSLIDWVKKDSSIPHAKADIDALYSNKWLKICGDLATSAKHFVFTNRKPITSSSTSRQGYGIGRYKKGAYGVGEELIAVSLTDGSEISSLEIVLNVIDTWQLYFTKHKI